MCDCPEHVTLHVTFWNIGMWGVYPTLQNICLPSVHLSSVPQKYNTTGDVLREVTHDVTHDATCDVTHDVTRDVMCDVTRDVMCDVTCDVTHDDVMRAVM
jgi:hypothetical protein